MMQQTRLDQLIRPRRLRRNAAIRALVREHEVRISQFVQPIFVAESASMQGEISSMPGVMRHSLESAVREARELDALGIVSIMLFGIPERKDALASGNYDPDGIVQRTARAIKDVLPHMVVMADLCNCEYTDHGHCGIVTPAGEIDNDASVELLVRAALTYARSGVDVVVPSDMMDGRVGAIRRALDADGFTGVAIMAHGAKYASAFYGPFREAAQSAPQFGDRRSHQMDPPNAREAMREIALDIDEGADVIMIKPALAYLDVVRAAREAFDVPLAVYNVSGEYAMVKAAARNGWIDEERMVDEILVSFVRAGADIITTYFAKDYATRHRA